MVIDSLKGKSVVVTGKIDGLGRDAAYALLREHGALIQKSVTQATDVLIYGENVGATKTDKARALGVATISWDEAYSILYGGNGGRSVQAAAAPKAHRARVTSPDLHPYREVGPMLCKNAPALPTSGSWIHEIKWDGFRGIAHVYPDGTVRLMSRAGNEYAQFPSLNAELSTLPPCVMDGEIVALDENGRSHFHEKTLSDSNVSYIAFDVIESAGERVTDLPLNQRRVLLSSIFDLAQGRTPRLSISPAFDDGQALLDYAIQEGLEGIVAKQEHSTYRENKRGPEWLKIKLRTEQEFVVVGFTEGKGARAGTAGALLLAVYEDDGSMTFCGSVGTGGTYAEFSALVAQMTERPDAPLVHDLKKFELKDVTWVEPRVVVQVRFQCWTPDGKLWHPSLQGQRTDKHPTEVRREA